MLQEPSTSLDKRLLTQLASAQYEATLSTSFGRPPNDLSLQWIAATALAVITDGILEEPQEGHQVAASDALDYACQQITNESL